MERQMAPPIPKEHGAWALLYGPFLVVALIAATLEPRLLLFFLAMTALFLAHEPMAKVVSVSKHGVRREKKRYWLRWLGIYVSVALASSAVLIFVHDLWKLIPLGLGVAALLSIHLYLTSQRKERHLLGEAVGVVGLTASAPITYYVLEGSLDFTALLLWILNLLYFLSGLFFVKMKVNRFIKKDQYAKRVIHCCAYHVFVLFALSWLIGAGWIPMLAALAYVPILLRAFWGVVFPDDQLNLKRIGYTELGYTVAFVVLLSLGF